MGETLKQLWISYNSIATLDGLSPCKKLEVLYMSNNKIKDWSELDKINALPTLQQILLLGNPIYEGLSKSKARHKVVEQLPSIQNVDGEMITGEDDDEDGEPESP